MSVEWFGWEAPIVVPAGDVVVVQLRRVHDGEVAPTTLINLPIGTPVIRTGMIGHLTASLRLDVEYRDVGGENLSTNIVPWDTVEQIAQYVESYGEDFHAVADGIRGWRRSTIHIEQQDKVPCVMCDGTGMTSILTPCETCDGTGRREYVGRVDASAWRNYVRGGLGPRRQIEFDERAFVECDRCDARSGTPTLCVGCLANRTTVTDVRAEITKLKNALASALHELDEHRREYHHVTSPEKIRAWVELVK